jgi:hypothetical protein
VPHPGSRNRNSLARASPTRVALALLALLPTSHLDELANAHSLWTATAWSVCDTMPVACAAMVNTRWKDVDAPDADR